MSQPTFGVHSFADGGGPNPKDAFELVTGEVLQNARAQFPERSFLVDENVQVVADRIHGSGGTGLTKFHLAEQYVGLWVIVRFSLGDHTSRFGMEIVRAQHPAESEPQAPGRVATPLRYGLTAIFDTEPWGEKLAAMKVGDALTVMGQIEQLNPMEIRLRHCELA